ncbi:MAG: N-acetyltransferase, partial [Pseudomonadota bacterium]
MTHLPDTLTTARLILRRPALGDLAAYVAYYTGPRTTGVGGPRPRNDVVDRFHAMAGQWALRGYGRYVITQGGAGFGHVGI